jgi:enterochelin esterase-like enzyme
VKPLKIKILLLLLLPFSFQLTAYCQEGRVIESLTMESDLLEGQVKYSVYLPPDYDKSERSYPVLYLLHGYSGNETVWIQFGEVDRMADDAIKEGEVSSFIIIMPDGKTNWYSNDYQGLESYEDMFIREFIPFIEKQYRIRSKKEFRAIAGNSMGGYGALKFAMKYNHLFSACVAFSSGIFTDVEITNMPDSIYGILDGIYGKNLKGNERINENWENNSPLYLVKAITGDKLKSVRFYIDCGDDDFLYRGNSELHKLMRDLKIPHEYRVRDGGHNWRYWREGLPAGLSFINKSFTREIGF